MNITSFRALFVTIFVMLSAVLAYPGGPGSFDLSFAGAGYRYDTFGTPAHGSNVIVQPDNKIVSTVGSTGDAPPQFLGLVRYNPDGSLDTSFGVGGKVQTVFSPGALPGDLVLQPDGKIVVGSTTGGPASSGNRRITVLRYNPDGSLDTSFGTGGIVITSVPNTSYCTAGSVALQPDGKIVVSGQAISVIQVATYLVVVRYNPDGSLDTSFDGDGIVNTRTQSVGWAGSLAIQPDGKIVAGGATSGGSDKGVLIRLNPNGSLDTSFDGDGIVITIMHSVGIARFGTIQLLPDGRIIAAGRAGEGPTTNVTYDFAIARFNPDGSLDTTFDGDGKVTTPILSGSDNVTRVLVQPDGKVLAAGYAKNATNYDMVLVRYNIDGSLDSTYGSGGKVVIDQGGDDHIYGAVLDSMGKAIVVGGEGTAFIARIMSDFAPLVDVGGRVTSTNGQGIGNATVVLTDANNISQTARTNAFGYYSFAGVSSNEIYTVRVSSKRYRFQPSSQTITLTESVANVDFAGNPGSESKNAIPGNKGALMEVPEASQRKF